MAQIRMYIQKGCPHCEQAKAFFDAKQVSVELIEIGFDPVLQAGLRASFNGSNFQIPLIVSFATQEVVVGNDPVQLNRLAAVYGSPASTSNAAA